MKRVRLDEGAYILRYLVSTGILGGGAARSRICIRSETLVWWFGGML